MSLFFSRLALWGSLVFLKTSKLKGRKCYLSKPQISREPGPRQKECFLDRGILILQMGRGRFCDFSLGSNFTSKHNSKSKFFSDIGQKGTSIIPQF